jgi:hypothetical protein
MREQLHNAKEELKRVDHLIYVSLKYTRTVDVLRNVINRLINSHGFIADSLLAKAEEDGIIDEKPTAAKLKADKMLELYEEDPKIVESVKLYLLLRKMVLTEYTKENEYRRHVTMITVVDGEKLRIDIDQVTEYYKKAKELIEYIENKYPEHD